MEKTKEIALIGIKLTSSLSDELAIGSFLSNDKMDELGIKPTTSVLPDMVRMSTKEAFERLVVSDDHDLETFSVLSEDNTLIHMQKTELLKRMVIPNQGSWLMGVRNKQSKQVIVEAAYFDIIIINSETVLINGFLLVPIKYIDGTLTYINSQLRNESLRKIKPSEMIFKIAVNTKEYPYAVQRDNTIVLISAEEIYEVKLRGYSQQELISLGILEDSKKVHKNKQRTRALWD